MNEEQMNSLIGELLGTHPAPANDRSQKTEQTASTVKTDAPAGEPQQISAEDLYIHPSELRASGVRPDFIKVTDEGDKFDKRIVTTMAHDYKIELSKYFTNVHFNFRQIETQDATVLCLEVTIINGRGGIGLANGYVLIRFDGDKDLKLDNIVDLRHGSWDSCACPLPPVAIKLFCEAKTIDIKFYGREGSLAVEANGLIQYAQKFYNGCYDENAYTDAIPVSSSAPVSKPVETAANTSTSNSAESSSSLNDLLASPHEEKKVAEQAASSIKTDAPDSDSQQAPAEDAGIHISELRASGIRPDYIEVADEGDKFDKRIVIQMKDDYGIDFSQPFFGSAAFRFRQVETQNGSVLFLNISIIGIPLPGSSDDARIGLAGGYVLVVFDGAYDFKLDRLEDLGSSGSWDTCACPLPPAMIRAFCEAKTVDISFCGRDGSLAVEANGLIQYAQQFYNGCYDENAYTDAIPADSVVKSDSENAAAVEQESAQQPTGKSDSNYPSAGEEEHSSHWAVWFILALAVIGFIMVSVVTSRNGKSCKDLYADTIDTVPFDDSWIEDSVNMTKKVTPDLAFFELHGPVKSLVVECCSHRHKYKFSQDGQLVMSDGEDPYDGWYSDSTVIYTKDAQGRIVRGDDLCLGREYTWDSEKPVMEKWFSEGYRGEVSYVYDTRGFVIQTKSTGYDQSGQCDDQSIEKYEFTRIDKFGNWIERKDADGDITNRRIEYYPITRNY